MLHRPLVIFVSIAVVAKGSTLFPNSASVAEITNVNPAVNTVVKSHSKGRSWHKGPCGSDCKEHVRHDLQVCLVAWPSQSLVF